MEKKPPSISEKVQLARRLLKQKKRLKKVYKQLDELTAELLKERKALAAGGIALVNNFKGKLTVYKPAGVSRFSLVLIEDQKIAARGASRGHALPGSK